MAVEVSRSRTGFPIHHHENPKGLNAITINRNLLQNVRLFKVRRDHEFDERPLHGTWAPLNGRPKGGHPLADLYV